MADDTYAAHGWNSVLRANRPSYVQCDRVVEATLYPGQPAIKGTSAHQLQQAAEDAKNVVGIPECQSSVDIDTAMVAGTDIEDFYYLGLGAIVGGMIQANIEAIVMGDRLTVAAESGKWRGHPDDLAIDVAGADTVTKNTFTGFREQSSSVMAMETLAKDASDDQLIKVMT